MPAFLLTLEASYSSFKAELTALCVWEVSADFADCLQPLFSAFLAGSGRLHFIFHTELITVCLLFWQPHLAWVHWGLELCVFISDHCTHTITFVTFVILYYITITFVTFVTLHYICYSNILHNIYNKTEQKSLLTSMWFSKVRSKYLFGFFSYSIIILDLSHTHFCLLEISQLFRNGTSWTSRNLKVLAQ